MLRSWINKRMHPMTRWLRRRYWALEDAITDALDWQPHQAPPLKPAPRRAPPPMKAPPPAQHYANWTACGLGDSQNIAVESVNADLLRKVLAQLGADHLFEIKQ